MNLLPEVKDGHLVESEPTDERQMIGYGYMFSLLSHAQRVKIARLMRQGLNGLQALHVVCIRRHFVPR